MEIFLARQAIYDKKEKVIAYEILYRSSLENVFDRNAEPDEATYKVIQNISTFGIDILTNNKVAFINFPEEAINRDMATLLPNKKVIIEVLETVKPTREIIRNLKILKEKGYSIALDDISTYKQIVEFLDVVDIVKVDYKLCSKYERLNITQKLKANNIKLLAEKIETKEELQEAKNLGFDYFQGYYFSKPVVLQGQEIKTKNETIFNIVVELLKEEFNIYRVEQLIKCDIGLSYKFLKLINSAYFNFIQDVSSINHAIMLVGRNELRKWLSIILVSEMNSTKSEEYANNTLNRAKMCELIAETDITSDKNLAFMVGLFSDIDILIKKPLNEVIGELPVSKKVKDALMGKDNYYKWVLDLVTAYESMDKERIEIIASKMGIDVILVGKIYLETIEWGNKMYNVNELSKK